MPEDSVPVDGTVSNLSLFPNPASGKVTIGSDVQLTECLEYSVYNISGQLVSRGSIQSCTEEINVSSLTSGIYYIRFHSEMVKPRMLEFVKY